MAKFNKDISGPNGAHLTKGGRVQKNRTEQRFRKAELRRYKAETRAAAHAAKAEAKIAVRTAKTNAKIAKINAKNAAPIERAKLNASVAKHAAWAATASDIFGKGSQTIQAVNTANAANQNVNGGLSGTSSGRDEDDDDEGKYKVYKKV